MTFQSRNQAGILLANQIKVDKIALVLSIPRGGVVVGKTVADSLNLPHDIIITRKLGAPGNPELAIGAVAEGNITELNQDLIQQLQISQEFVTQEIKNGKKEIIKRKKEFRSAKNLKNLKGKTVIIIDDGIATGETVIAAIKAVKLENPDKIILAVPVAPQDTLDKIRPLVDKIICLEVPENFQAVGQFYENWEEVTDEKVKELIKK